MPIKGFFFSLKWKIAILIGSVFLFVHSTFSYLVYLDATEDFFRNRHYIQNRYSNIARALAKDSFLVLDQFADLFSVIKNEKQAEINPVTEIVSTLDKNWQQWQYIWGLESAVFFNQTGDLIKHWGDLLIPGSKSVLSVLKNQSPDHQIVCPDTCFQLVLIPVMANAEMIGAFGVSRSFADTVIQFSRATASDIGVLVPTEHPPEFKWPYAISAITHVQRNKDVLDMAAANYMFTEFLDQSKVIKHNEKSYEISIFSVEEKEEGPPFFLLIEDISSDLKALNANLQTIWFYGVISLIFSLALLLIVLFLSLRKVIKLSDALPFLANQKYDEFRKVLVDQASKSVSFDEMDLLNHTALTLTDQLEGLEKEIKENVGKLIEQGQELKSEKNFIQQLINVAPIIVITQDSNGIIQSINQAGIYEFGMEESLIIGSVFDNYIVDTEVEHLAELKKLRKSDSPCHYKIDSVLMVSPGQKRYISWIHSVVKPKLNNGISLILSLGVDISERKKIEDQMLSVATQDQLTGISNRHNFHLEFSRELASAKRYGHQLALLYLDLDQFKIVNDTCGHEVGDKLLRLVSKSLQKLVRKTDLLSRIGGDEFTLIMPNAELQGIEMIAKKINQSLTQLVFSVEEEIFKISTSIGVAIYPQHGTDIHELLSNADLAMYQAKGSGSGQYHIYSPDRDYQSRLTKRIYWKEIIEEALRNDRFVLCYQPILDVQANQISHYECLSRIRTEQGKLLMPAEFIGFAEELGLIGKIDRLVLNKAIERHIQFKQQGKNIKLAVNLSGLSFNDTTIFEDISSLLDRPEVDPGQIIFEITETAAVSNFAAAQDLIQKIKALGCSLALDDFGVGFSSFYYLKHLPVDYVKIDGSFISQLDKNRDDKVFVKALTEVSQALGKKTVAEFVENEAILEVLREFGIDYAQGYHIGKPDYIE